MTTESRTPSELESNLEGCWVVLIYDPDHADTSPWPVVADDIGGAVAKAVQAWEDWQFDPTDPSPDPLEKPHIFKIYRNSWITEIAWGERYREGLGSYDMSKLANPSRD